MDINAFERAVTRLASKFRKDFSQIGPEDTKVKIMDDFIIIKYVSHYTKPELFHHQIMKEHPEQAVYTTFLETLASYIKADFSRELPDVLPDAGIVVEEVVTRYFAEDYSSQIVIIKTNVNFELLLAPPPKAVKPPKPTRQQHRPRTQ